MLVIIFPKKLSSIPEIELRSVVLPQPLGPSIDIISFSFKLNDIFSKIFLLLKDFEIFEISSVVFKRIPFAGIIQKSGITGRLYSKPSQQIAPQILH